LKASFVVDEQLGTQSTTWLTIFSERELIVRPSVVCRLSVCLSVCRLSVKSVHPHPTQAIEIFGNISTPSGMLAICWNPGKILRRSSQGKPSVVGVKHNRGSRI